MAEKLLSTKRPFVRTSALILATGTLLILSILILCGALIRNEHRFATDAIEQRALNSAHVISANYQWILEASDQTLQRLESAFQRGDRNELPETIADINEIVGNLPEGFQYAVYNQNGFLTYSSIIGASRIEVEDREYFRQLKSGEQLVVTEQLHERLSGQQVFIVARAIRRDGEFRGVVSIAIPVETMAALADTLQLSARSTISLLRLDGMLIARDPPLPEAQSFSSAQVFAELKETEQGTYVAISPADGVERTIGYWRIQGWPIVAVAGISNLQALAPFWDRIRVWLAVGVPALAATMGLLGWLSHLVHREDARRVALAGAYQRNEFLLREIHHRVKNNLQVVASLIRLQTMPKQEKISLTSRISAMVAIHEEVYRSDQFETIQVTPYLRRLVEDNSEAYGQDFEINYAFEDITLSGDRAMQLGLLLNELVSNAFKHAFDGPNGRLDLSLRRLEDGRIELCVRDFGRGFKPEKSQDSMGGRLIKAFLAHLDAEYELIPENGTTVYVRFKEDESK